AKLCLVTPTIFSASLRLLRRKPNTDAWRPFWLSDRLQPPGEHYLQHCRLRLVAAVTPRPYPLGFWDSKPEYKLDDQAAERLEGGPGAAKPLYRCLPSGSVYFVELTPHDATP